MPEENDRATAEIAKEIKSGEKWLIGIGLATLIINTGIALIYWGQLNQMRAATGAATKASKTAADTLQEMRTGSGASDTHTLAQQAITQATQTTNLANAAENQSAAAIRAADAAKSAADTARRALEASETVDRPWVAYSDSEIVPKDGDVPWQYRVVWKNGGNSPAFDVRIHETAALYDAKLDWAAVKLMLDGIKVSDKPGFTLLSGQETERMGSDHVIFSDAQKADIKLGLQVIVSVGAAMYKDSFGNEHITTYCRTYQPGYNGIKDRMFPCQIKETAN